MLRDPRNPLKVLALGAGVQSSTLALMMEEGELEKPDYAIFSDTQAEPDHVYRWLEWLTSRLSYPVIRVTAGSLRDDILAASRGEGLNEARAPFFIRTSKGHRSMLWRQCTNRHKIVPLQAEVQKLVGLEPGGKVNGKRYKGPPLVRQFIGISLDEMQRMKDSGFPYLQHEYPLVDLKITRTDCLDWMERHGYPKPAKSSCTFCPYRRNHQWRDMKENDPASFEDACRIDDALRTPQYIELIKAGIDLNGEKFVGGGAYVHDSLKPLREIDFRTAEQAGQIGLDLTHPMNNECEGMCGV